MAMQMGNSGPRRAMISEINVTPMVDVMLVLLIIFMVTAPLLHEGISVNLPEAKGRQIESNEKNISIIIDKDGVLYVHQSLPGEKSRSKKVPLGELETYLKELYKGRIDKKIFVRADAEVDYGTVVQAIARAKAAGVEQLGLETQSNLVPPAMEKGKEP